MELSVKNRFKKVIIIAGVTAVIYLIIKYCLPLVTPFVLAFIIALIIVKPVNILEKLHINRNIGTILMMLVFFGMIVFVTYKCGGKLISQINSFTANSKKYVAGAEHAFGSCCNAIDDRFDLNTGSSLRFVSERMETVSDNLTKSITDIIMNGSALVVSGFAKFFTGFAFMIMAVFFFCRDMNKSRLKAGKHGFFKEYDFIRGRLKKVLGTYVKTQLIIMLLTTIICVMGLYIMGNDYPLLLGVVIGIMDALPVLGTGTLFLPWIVVDVILGKYKKAVMLLVIYLVCYYMRQFLEPKMMGSRLGVSPVWMLISIYAGLKLFGISGVITGPIGLIMIKEISCVLIKKTI